MDIRSFFAEYWWVIVLVVILFGSFFTVNQGYVGVVTMFGKYRRPAKPGTEHEDSRSSSRY